MWIVNRVEVKTEYVRFARTFLSNLVVELNEIGHSRILFFSKKEQMECSKNCVQSFEESCNVKNNVKWLKIFLFSVMGPLVAP